MAIPSIRASLPAIEQLVWAPAHCHGASTSLSNASTAVKEYLACVGKPVEELLHGDCQCMHGSICNLGSLKAQLLRGLTRISELGCYRTIWKCFVRSRLRNSRNGGALWA